MDKDRGANIERDVAGHALIDPAAREFAPFDAASLELSRLLLPRPNSSFGGRARRRRSAMTAPADMPRLSEKTAFRAVQWSAVPNGPGVYVIFDLDEVIYVGMAGRNGSGSLRSRLKDHSSGQIVNMFAQYLFLARVQFTSEVRIVHPRDAKAACRKYIAERLSFSVCETVDATEARRLELELKRTLRPTLNP